jgi:uncharacterized membrane protein YebE (DUF533 family)
MADDEDSKKDPTTSDANTLLLGGLGIGAVGLISAAIGGAVCPVCVVAAPALLGVGAYKRWRAGRARAADAQPESPPPSGPSIDASSPASPPASTASLASPPASTGLASTISPLDIRTGR